MVFNDAVVYHSDLRAGHMRMRIALRRHAVGGPAGMGNADGALHVALLHRQFQLTVPFAQRIFDLARRPSDDGLGAGYTGQITSNAFMKREFGTKLVEEAHDWGMKESMNKAAAIEKLTQAAVEAAPGKGANYAYLHLPGEANVGALNVNAFNDPEVIYYKCASLPAPK